MRRKNEGVPATVMAGDARKEIKISEGIIIITGDDDGREMHGGKMSVGQRVNLVIVLLQ